MAARSGATREWIGRVGCLIGRDLARSGSSTINVSRRSQSTTRDVDATDLPPCPSMSTATSSLNNRFVHDLLRDDRLVDRSAARPSLATPDADRPSVPCESRPRQRGAHDVTTVELRRERQDDEAGADCHINRDDRRPRSVAAMSTTRALAAVAAMSATAATVAAMATTGAMASSVTANQGRVETRGRPSPRTPGALAASPPAGSVAAEAVTGGFTQKGIAMRWGCMRGALRSAPRMRAEHRAPTSGTEGPG